MIISTLYSNASSAPDFDGEGWHDFKPKEVECRHCHEVLIHTQSMDCLQALRTKMGRPLVINSGYRCPEHNNAVGGSPNSLHKLGRAFDISTRGWSDSDINKLTGKANVVGFGGIGTYTTFVHVDTGPVRDWVG